MSVNIVLKEDGEWVELKEGAKLVQGVEYTVALPRAGKDSDERRLFVDGTEVAQIDDADNARQYKVKFDKTGEVTLTFEAFQSETLDKATAEGKVTVKVEAPQPKELKQISANSFAVVFSHNMTGLIDPAKIKNDDIYYMIAGEKIVTGAIKSAALDKDDPTRVVITRYTNFIENETYFFHYGDSEDDLSFKAAANKLENVDTITVGVDGACYIDVPTAIVVKYFDKNGVQLDVDATPIFVITPDDVAYQSTTSNGSPAINFAAEGTATIKVTVNLGYDSETYAPIEKSAEVQVVGTKKSAEAASVKYSFGSNPDPSKEVHVIRLNQETVDGPIKLKVSFKGVDGNEVSSYVSGDASGYYLKSTAEDIVQVVTGDTVRGVNVGNAVILLCYKDSNDKEQVLKAFPIEVKEANKGTTAVTAVLDQVTINKNYPGEDQATLTVTALDLDGKAYDDTKLSYEIKQIDNNAKAVGLQLSTTKANAIVAAGTDTYSNNSVDFTFDGDDFEVYGSAATNNTWTTSGLARVAFELTVKDVTNPYSPVVLAKKTLSITLADIDPDAPGAGVTIGYKMAASKTALDTTKKNFKHAAAGAVVSSDITLQQTATKNGNQFYAGTAEFTVIKSRNDIPTTVASFGTGTTFGSINYVIISQPYGTSTTDITNRNKIITALDDTLTAITPSDNADTDGIFAFDSDNHNISMSNVGQITVSNFENDTATNGVVAKSSTYTFTGVRVDYNTYVDNDNNVGTTGVKQTGARKELGTASVTVSGNDVKATYTEKAGISASALKAVLETGAVDVSGQFKVTWDGINSDITASDDADNNGRITVQCLQDPSYFKIDDKTGAIYIYKIKAIIKTFDNQVNSSKQMSLEQDIVVNKLYKD